MSCFCFVCLALLFMMRRVEASEDNVVYFLYVLFCSALYEISVFLATLHWLCLLFYYFYFCFFSVPYPVWHQFLFMCTVFFPSLLCIIQKQQAIHLLVSNKPQSNFHIIEYSQSSLTSVCHQEAQLTRRSCCVIWPCILFFSSYNANYCIPISQIFLISQATAFSPLLPWWDMFDFVGRQNPRYFVGRQPCTLVYVRLQSSEAFCLGITTHQF